MTIPAISMVILTVAAFVYSVKTILEWVTGYVTGINSRRVKAFNDLHDTAADEIKTPFDFWWTGEPSKTVRASLNQQLIAGTGEEALQALPEGLVKTLLDYHVADIRNTAYHVALHARMDTGRRKMIDKLPETVREAARKEAAACSELVATERLRLVSFGIDPDELEAEFAQKTT